MNVYTNCEAHLNSNAMRKLTEYPRAIYEAERLVLDLASRHRAVTERLSRIELEWRAEAANKDIHPDLTNDAKRSAWIEEQKASNPEYETIAREAESARNNADMAKLRLNMLRDEFRVARILALARIPDETADLM